MSAQLVDFSTGEVVAVTLAELEQVIDRGLRSYVEVGEALAKVRNSEVYKAIADTFEDYCKIRWGLSRTRSWELISGAETTFAIANADDAAPLPANEAQARALNGLDGPAAAATMCKAQEEAGDKPLTAADIAAARRRIEADPDPADPPTPTELVEAAHTRRLLASRKKVVAVLDALTVLGDLSPDDFFWDDLCDLTHAGDEFSKLAARNKGAQRKTKNEGTV